MQRHLGDAVHRGRQLGVGKVEDRRRKVTDVMELVAHRARRFSRQPCRPVHDQRVAHATAVGVLLVELARGVAGHRPAERVVVEPLRLADLGDAIERLLERHRCPLEIAALVQSAGMAALLRSAVVAHDHEDRVGERTDPFESVDQPAHFTVGVRQHGRERRLEAHVQLSFLGG